MFLSSFRFYSIGLVAEDKAKDSHTVPVVPMEILPDITGEIADLIDSTEMSGVDASEKTYTITLKTSATISANWLPLGNGNRITPPDLIKGEKVMIFQMADTDRFYWTTLGNTHDYRRLETVVWAFSATADHAEELDPATNMYTFEVSTDTKKIILNTTQANGEPFRYTITLDTETGKLSILDKENDESDSNEISLNSAERIIKLYNTDGTFIELNKESILGYCKTMIDIKTDGDAKVHVEKNLDCTVNGDITTKVKGNLTADVEGHYAAKAPTMDFGEDADLEPSLLGDKTAANWVKAEAFINSMQAIGNLGIPTSMLSAGPPGPLSIAGLQPGGDSYSTKNKNQ